MTKALLIAAGLVAALPGAGFAQADPHAPPAAKDARPAPAGRKPVDPKRLPKIVTESDDAYRAEQQRVNRSMQICTGCD